MNSQSRTQGFVTAVEARIARLIRPLSLTILRYPIATAAAAFDNLVHGSRPGLELDPTAPSYFNDVELVAAALGEYPPLPLDPGSERMPTDEPKLALELARIAADAVIANYCAARATDPLAVAQRDQHAKENGFVEAIFTVVDDLPLQFAVGVFQPGRQYKSRVRFSNVLASKSDRSPNGRGMAIKLLDVSGTPIEPIALTTEASSGLEQDFLLTNHSVFLARNVSDYVQIERFAAVPKKLNLTFIRAALKYGLFYLFHLRLAFLLIASTLEPAPDPLDITYHSMSPYRFGPDKVVRYIARPVTQVAYPSPPASPDYLRRRMEARLVPEAKAVSIDFLIQVRDKATADDVENASRAWRRPKDIVVPLARIEIPAQNFDRAAVRYQGETVSFTPWNCLADHRPIGGINRIRLAAYRASKRARHCLNAVT